ncbi:hypothetical protein O1L44_19440 [Streptomyces noursei]|nr:hypothetical protein [Streptomyces noursei]
MIRAPGTAALRQTANAERSVARLASSWSLVSSGCPGGSPATTIRRLVSIRSRISSPDTSVP